MEYQAKVALFCQFNIKDGTQKHILLSHYKQIDSTQALPCWNLRSLKYIVFCVFVVYIIHINMFISKIHLNLQKSKNCFRVVTVCNVCLKCYDTAVRGLVQMFAVHHVKVKSREWPDGTAWF